MSYSILHFVSCLIDFKNVRLFVQMPASIRFCFDWGTLVPLQFRARDAEAFRDRCVLLISVSSHGKTEK
jgi:hypothetical protein